MADRITVINQIINYINKNIASGAWPVGQKMPSENELCRELGVSRVSVRSALQQYIALGILKSYHGKGTYILTNDLSVFGLGKVSCESMNDMEQVLGFRSMIEPEIASIAARTATPEMIRQLSDSLDKMHASVGDSEAFVRYDIAFHTLLCSATNNAIVQSVMTDIFNKKLYIHRMINVTVGYYGGMYYHYLILDAIKKHDSKRARALMSEHLKMSMDELSLDTESPESPKTEEDK